MRSPDKSRLRHGQGAQTRDLIRKQLSRGGIINTNSIPDRGTADAYGNTFAGLPGTKLATKAVGSLELAFGTTDAERAVGVSHVQDNAIGSRALASSASDDSARSVGSDHLRIGSVLTAKLADGAVTTLKIGDNQVTLKIGDNQVNNNKLASSTSDDSARAVTADHIRIDAVTAAKVATNAIGARALSASTTVDADRAVGTDHIKAEAVTTTKLGLLAVTAARIADDTITLGKMSSTANNPAQSTPGLRSISSVLGGSLVTAASGNHSHSVTFKLLPLDAQAKVARLRARVRAGKGTTGPVGRDEFELLRLQVLVLSHLALDDDIGERVEDRLRRLADDPAAREAWEKERWPQGDRWGFYANPDPEITSLPAA